MLTPEAPMGSLSSTISSGAAYPEGQSSRISLEGACPEEGQVELEGTLWLRVSVSKCMVGTGLIGDTDMLLAWSVAPADPGIVETPVCVRARAYVCVHVRERVYRYM